MTGEVGVRPVGGGSALWRAVRRPTAAEPGAGAERCEMCAVAVPDRHRHVLDEQRDDLLCVCQACTLLFHRDAAGRGHYRLVPDRTVRLPHFAVANLGIPVGLAFLVVADDGSVLAHYPSPLGMTRWEIDADAWPRVVERCPELADLAPRVEALLLRTTRGADERWLVPLDTCHRLVALIRREWRGLSGGSRVWPEIDRFFAALARSPGRPSRSTAGAESPREGGQPHGQGQEARVVDQGR